MAVLTESEGWGGRGGGGGRLKKAKGYSSIWVSHSYSSSCCDPLGGVVVVVKVGGRVKKAKDYRSVWVSHPYSSSH